MCSIFNEEVKWKQGNVIITVLVYNLRKKNTFAVAVSFLQGFADMCFSFISFFEPTNVDVYRKKVINNDKITDIIRESISIDTFKRKLKT